MQTRREALRQGALAVSALAAGSLLPQQAQAYNKAAFEVKAVPEALKALGATGALTESKDVSLTAPDIAENGAVVPLALATTLPNVKQLILMVEKNPSPLVAVFNITPEIEPSFGTRSKMGQSSDVYAIAITSDGKALYTKKEVKVTLGGCGG